MKKIILGTLVLGVSLFAEVKLADCATCHGVEFDKSAMDSSQVVSLLTKIEVTEALQGYKDGTYGGPMKAIMVEQVAKYTNEELAATGIGRENNHGRSNPYGPRQAGGHVVAE